MADKVRRVDYYYVEIPDHAGEAARVFQTLKDTGVNLLSFTAFPSGTDKGHVDVVPEHAEEFMKAAKAAGLNITARKQALYVQGADRIGAAAEIFNKLADAKVNVRAANACASERGFGMLLWVKPEQLDAAARALGA